MDRKEKFVYQWEVCPYTGRVIVRIMRPEGTPFEIVCQHVYDLESTRYAA